MSDAPDVLGQIASLAGLYKENEAALRKSIQDLSDRLAAASSGTRLTHGTETFTLAQLGPDHVVYGHLFYDEEGIRVAHRSTEDDLADLDDPSDRCFLLMTIDECPLEWLRSLTAEDAFSKLIFQIGFRIDTETVKMETEATTILELTSDPSLCVSASFEQAAKTLTKLPPRRAAQIILAIENIAKNPTRSDLDIRKLTNRSGYRLRVGEWRIIYTEDGKILAIERIAPRGGAY